MTSSRPTISDDEFSRSWLIAQDSRRLKVRAIEKGRQTYGTIRHRGRETTCCLDNQQTAGMDAMATT